MRLEIYDRNFSNFKSYEVNLVFNAVASSFNFTAQSGFLNKLIDYPICKIHNDSNQLLIRGVILPSTLKSSPVSEDIKVQGYSLAGVLEDCQISVDNYPLQYDGMNLAQIASKVLNKLFVHAKYTSIVKKDMLKIYEKIEADPKQTIKDFLNELASERNIILSHRPDGTLLFTRLDVSVLKPIDTFEIGKHGIKRMTLQIDGQKLHNPIFVLSQADSEENGDSSQAELRNPYVAYPRPKVIIAGASDEFDADKTARNELAKELAGIKLTFETTKFNFPGQLILVKNSDLKLNKFTEFFIEAVKIKGASNQKDNYTYTCVLKDVYTNNEVKNVLK